MEEKKEEKVTKVKNFLDSKGIFYEEFEFGHLKVDTVSLWATTQKFYDEKTGFKGQGVNAFIKHLKEKGAI